MLIIFLQCPHCPKKFRDLRGDSDKFYSHLRAHYTSTTLHQYKDKIIDTKKPKPKVMSN